MERRTGTLEVKTKEQDVVFDVDEGALLRVLVNGKEQVAVEVLRDVMKWTTGRFSFKSGAVKPAFQRQGIGVLLLEVACGHQPIDPATGENLVRWVRDHRGKGDLLRAVDDGLGQRVFASELEPCSQAQQLGLVHACH